MAAAVGMASGPVRFMSALVGGPIVALLIFGGMRYLILSEGTEPDERVETPQIDITSDRTDSAAITRNDRPDEPDEVKAPPPPPRIEAAKSEVPDEGLASILGSLPEINPDAADAGDLSFQVSDRDAQPLVRINPVYPPRAQERGVEGTCNMTFNVFADGTIDGDSIQARCTSSLFARAATRSVARWKYQPKIQNGEPVPRYNVHTEVVFEFGDE